MSASNKKHVGVFAIPGANVPNIRRLYALFEQSMDNNRDDSSVLRNDVYRHAAEVCVHHVNVSLGRETVWGYHAMMNVLGRGLHLDEDQSVFTADEVHAMASGARTWERRAKGEDAIVARMHRRDRGVPIEVVRAMYRAFKQVLAVADERGTALVLAVLREGAEAALAEKRAEEEREQLAWEQRVAQRGADGDSDDDEWVFDQSDENQFGTQAWLEKNNAKYPDLTPERDPNQRVTPRQLVLVPARYAPALHKRLRQAARDFETVDTIAIRREVQEQAVARAARVIELCRYGETSSMKLIMGCASMYNGPTCDDRDFTVKQARQFARALDAWHADRGMDGVIDDVIDTLPGGKTRALCASAFDAFRRAFDEAVRTRCAVFVST